MNVFLSYAKENSPVVTRVCDDLNRAEGDLAVWCYEKTSRFGVDFRREYADRLRKSDCVVLFDSAAARRSQYVRDEIEIWQATPDIELLICLVQPEGDWRQEELFERQNYIVYFDLTDYEDGIRKLCEHFGLVFRPKFVMPRDRDFDEEMRRHGGALSLDDRQRILDQYDYFRSAFGHDPRTAEAQLIVLIAQYLRPHALEIVSPYLALGVLQIEAGSYGEAADTFGIVIDRWPNDPRGWAGRAAAHYQSDRYREAADDLRRCLVAIDKASNPEHRAHRAEVALNLASALRAAGEPEQALGVLERAIVDGEPAPMRVALEAGIRLTLGDGDKAAALYRDATDMLLDRDGIAIDLIIEVVEGARALGIPHTVELLLERGERIDPYDPDLQRAIAVERSGQGSWDEALRHYERALKYRPGDLRCLAEAALLASHMGARAKAAAFIATALERTRTPGGAEYFTGLVHFLDGREETARFHYDRAAVDPVSGGWPYYSELVA